MLLLVLSVQIGYLIWFTLILFKVRARLLPKNVVLRKPLAEHGIFFTFSAKKAKCGPLRGTIQFRDDCPEKCFWKTKHFMLNSPVV